MNPTTDLCSSPPRTAVDDSAPLVETRAVWKSYRLGDREVPVLADVTFSVAPGDRVAIMGRSGVGKSTLLHLLGALDQPSAGEIWSLGRSLTGLDDPSRADYRNRMVGFVFQFHHLQPEFTALENAAMPCLIARKGHRFAMARAAELLDAVGLAHRMQHKPGELSGGEQQRVALARALANEPRLILADEPTGNLDEPTSATIHELMVRLNESLGIAFVVATHSAHLARHMREVYHLQNGQLHRATPLPAGATPETWT